MTTRSRLTLKSAPFICDTGRVAIYLASASKLRLLSSGSLRFAHPSHCAALVGPSRSRGHGRPRASEETACSFCGEKQNKLFCSWSSQLMTEDYFPVYWPMKKMAPVLTSVMA